MRIWSGAGGKGIIAIGDEHPRPVPGGSQSGEDFRMNQFRGEHAITPFPARCSARARSSRSRKY
jgi:hypothetical protein